MKKITGTFPSASGLCNVHFYIYTPEKPKAVIMFSHGKSEYFERYEEFAKFLCANGIAFCGNDHVGHGKSVYNEEMYGYFGEERGYINMVRDLHRMRKIVDEKFPNLPKILMGHSMGSFLARIYLAKYPEDKQNAAIIMGTAGSMPGASFFSKLINVLKKLKGSNTPQDAAEKLFAKIYGIRVEDKRTANDWLSRDPENVDKFNADELCRHPFTMAGFRDLMNAMLFSNSAPVIESTPIDVPIMFMSGDMDPIGEYGSGVRKAVKLYEKQGCDVRKVHLYRDARHELLFELNRDEVLSDILEFINEILE